MNRKRMQSRRMLGAIVVCWAIFAVGVVVLAFALAGCARIRGTGGGKPPRAPLAIEQVLTWNAGLAEANLAVAKGIIAASEAGELETEYSNKVLTEQSRIADADRQLTPILSKACTPQKQIEACNAAVLSGDSAAIQGFVDTIRDASANLVKTGTAGIKNPQRAATVQQAIAGISFWIEQMAAGMKQLGVLK